MAGSYTHGTPREAHLAGYETRVAPALHVFAIDVWFQSWAGIGRVLIVGALAYAGLVALLRVSGARTLSKLNAFDLVVTVALGSTLATILTSKDVALVEGLVAFALLIGLQYVVTWCSLRFAPLRKLVKSEPILLVHRGRMLRDAMQRARVLDDEILAVLRDAGIGDPRDVRAVVLESDGTLSVVRETGEPARTLTNVRAPTVERTGDGA